jgi:hypothetical protein
MPEESPAGRPAWLERAATPARLAVAAAAVAAIVLASTTSAIPIVWDEGEYLWRSDRVVAWVHLLFDRASAQGGLHAFSASVIGDYWKFVTWDEGHPAWAAVPMAAATLLLSGVLHPLTTVRLGTVAVFSLGCGVVAFRARKSYGAVAAMVAVISLLTLPRLFSEAHFATLDAQLTAWWLMLWAADASLRTEVRSTVGVGVLAGLTSATKFTGWLAWMPLVASRMLRDRRQRTALLLIAPIGLLVFVLVDPPLWYHPVSGLIAHVRLNSFRSLNVPIAFLGRVYDMHHPLPWYNTIVWLVFVVPLPLLVLGLIGMVHCVRTRDAVSISLVLNWATLMVVRALPAAPPHDGIRLFLPAFGFWCVLAGVGAQRVWERSRRPVARWRGRLLGAAVAIGLAADAVNLVRYYPQTLSHYSILVGGVRGAASLGMEPTYWWDALDDEVLAWINQHPGEPVAFSSAANISMLRGWGRLQVPQADRGSAFKWYVQQNRTGFLGDVDRRLIRDVKPAYTKYAGRHREEGTVPADLDVPLLRIYTYDEFKAAVEAVSAEQGR